MNSRRRISAPRLGGQHCIGSNEYFDRAQTGHQKRCRSAQPCRRWVKTRIYRTATATAGSPQLADIPGSRCRVHDRDCNMPFTLRPTGLSSPAYRDWADYIVIEDGEGHRANVRGPAYAADLRWFLIPSRFTSIPSGAITTSGRAPSLDEAKAQFLTDWQNCRTDSTSCPRVPT